METGKPTFNITSTRVKKTTETRKTFNFISTTTAMCVPLNNLALIGSLFYSLASGLWRLGKPEPLVAIGNKVFTQKQ